MTTTHSIQIPGMLVIGVMLTQFAAAQVPAQSPETIQPKLRTRPATPPRWIPQPGGSTCAPGDANSQLAHEQLLEKAKKGGIDIYFEGDSITRRWGATDYPHVSCKLEHEFLRMERGGFRLGRRPDSEHSLAAGERGTGRRESKNHRAARGHQQCGSTAGRRRQSRGHHPRHQGGPGRLPAKSPRCDDHFDRHFSAQRQHGRDPRPSTKSTTTSRNLPTEKRSAF